MPVPEEIPILTTERLRLEALELSDVQDVFEIFSDSKVMRYWSRPPMQETAEAEELVTDAIEAFAKGTSFRWGVRARENALGNPSDAARERAHPPIIGTVSLFHLDEQNRRGEIGYALNSAYWGRGLMHEALMAVVAYAFDQNGLDLGRLEADLDPRNAASLRSLERLGFVREGLLRERWIVAGETTDSLIMGLLRREWAPRFQP